MRWLSVLDFHVDIGGGSTSQFIRDADSLLEFEFLLGMDILGGSFGNEGQECIGGHGAQLVLHGDFAFLDFDNQLANLGAIGANQIQLGGAVHGQIDLGVVGNFLASHISNGLSSGVHGAVSANVLLAQLYAAASALLDHLTGLGSGGLTDSDPFASFVTQSFDFLNLSAFLNSAALGASNSFLASFGAGGFFHNDSIVAPSMLASALDNLSFANIAAHRANLRHFTIQAAISFLGNDPSKLMTQRISFHSMSRATAIDRASFGKAALFSASRFNNIGAMIRISIPHMTLGRNFLNLGRIATSALYSKAALFSAGGFYFVKLLSAPFMAKSFLGFLGFDNIAANGALHFAHFGLSAGSFGNNLRIASLMIGQGQVGLGSFINIAAYAALENSVVFLAGLVVYFNQTHLVFAGGRDFFGLGLVAYRAGKSLYTSLAAGSFGRDFAVIPLMLARGSNYFRLGVAAE